MFNFYVFHNKCQINIYLRFHMTKMEKSEARMCWWDTWNRTNSDVTKLMESWLGLSYSSWKTTEMRKESDGRRKVTKTGGNHIKYGWREELDRWKRTRCLAKGLNWFFITEHVQWMRFTSEKEGGTRKKLDRFLGQVRLYGFIIFRQEEAHALEEEVGVLGEAPPSVIGSNGFT